MIDILPSLNTLHRKVTMLAVDGASAVPIDLAVNCSTPLRNAALITQCGRLDAHARALILLVRRWARDRGICHAAKGHLPPYCWTLLAILGKRPGVGSGGRRSAGVLRGGGGGGAQGGGPESGARGPRPSALQARVTNSGADFEAPEPVRRTRSGVLKLRTRSETAGADSSSKPPQALGARSSDEERFRRALAPDVGPLPPQTDLRAPDVADPHIVDKAVYFLQAGMEEGDAVLPPLRGLEAILGACRVG